MTARNFSFDASVFVKLILAHCAISFVLLLLGSFARHAETFFIVLVFGCLLYAYSGYAVTKNPIHILHYSGVAITGVLLWAFCFCASSGSTNYKRNPEAGMWFFDKFYLTITSCLDSTITDAKYSLSRELAILLITPVVLSGLQWAGGAYKNSNIQRQT